MIVPNYSNLCLIHTIDTSLASEMMFHGGARKEDHPLGAAWANNHFSGMVTSPPVTRGVHPVRSEPVSRFQNLNKF